MATQYMPPTRGIRKCKVADQVDRRFPDASEALAAYLQPFEEDRITRRIPLFIGKGLDPSTARQVAVLLTLERDRHGVRGRSCAECQNMQSPRACIAADAGFAEGPRDPAELWVCSYARLDHP